MIPSRRIPPLQVEMQTRVTASAKGLKVINLVVCRVKILVVDQDRRFLALGANHRLSALDVNRSRSESRIGIAHAIMPHASMKRNGGTLLSAKPPLSLAYLAGLNGKFPSALFTMNSHIPPWCDTCVTF